MLITYRQVCAECAECAEFGEIGIDENEIIRDLGKFEAEARYAVHFYHMRGDGFDDLCACGQGYFEISAEDAAMFPELADHLGEYVHLSESDTGFVYAEICTRAELDAHENEHAEDETIEDEA